MSIQAMTLDAEVHEVEEDLVEGGICVDNLEMILESWQEDKRKPKVLIVCPTGEHTLTIPLVLWFVNIMQNKMFVFF